jgi:hypothetical protein
MAPDYGDDPETPTGIWIIAGLGLVGAVLGLGAGVTAVAAGELPAIAGAALIGVALLQAVTMLALVGLTPWAWYATLLLYAVSGLLGLARADGGAVVVSLIVVAYVAAHRDLF